MRHGFTLIQLSILLTVASLVLVATLPATRSTVTAEIATTTKMNTVLSALRQYETANTKLPCPADASLATGNTSYGVAAANGGANCTGGTPKANYVDTGNKIAFGAVPVKALGLSSDYAIDSFGRSITYAVDTNATSCFIGTLPGEISVTDNGLATNTIAALVSHGADGHGAWIPLTGTSGTASRLNASSTDNDEHLVNAHGLGGGGFPSNYSTISSTVATSESTSTTFVKKPQTSTFDDIVVYKSNLWNLNSSPANASVVTMTASVAPASGNYIMNQVITVTATFTSNVTFSGGTPSISLQIGSNTRTAAYSSGNGTNSWTFAYTLLPSDYAPSGISVVSPMNTNGATLAASNGYCVNTTFTSPSNAVYVSAPSGVSTDSSTKCNSGGCVYVVDTNNSRLVKYDLSQNYIAQVGSSGTASTNFANPGFIAVGPSTNFYSYIADTGNNRIVRWKNSAATPSNSTTFGSSGTTAGKFNSPVGIALDATMNCASSTTACLWIADTGNNRVQRCAVGLSNCSVVATGTYNGLTLTNPTGIAVDAISTGCTTAGSPCIYIVDTGNNRILKFSGGATPAYVSTFGTAGGPGTAGTFNNPTGIAVDNGGHCAGSTNCLWIADTSNNQIQSCSVNMGGGTANCSLLSSLSSCSSPISPTTLNNPTGMTWNGTYVGAIDDNNSRIIFLGSDGSCSGAFGTPGSGNTNFNF